MPELTDPFRTNVPRKMTKGELARAIRQDIIAEHDAVALYEAHIDAIDDENIKALIQHIVDEEKEHVGEFTAILYMLDPEAAVKTDDGFEDGKLMLAGMPHPEEGGGEAEPELPTPQGLTVGNLIGQ